MGGATRPLTWNAVIALQQRYTIAFSQPDLAEKERAYLLEAFDSTWISSLGPFVGRFEDRFARWVGTAHAASCSNGTAALHLAMLSLGIGPGDEVIVPAMTYVATANAVGYVGAEPVFADCDPHTWTIDPKSVERLMSDRTRAIVAVHLFGVPCDMVPLRQLAQRCGVAIIEDAAEPHGAKLDGKPVGAWGDIATFSFYGNKIITTGEGGMVCTNRDDLAERVVCLRGQGSDRERTYWFDRVGYNYRLTNLACAIGLAQLERVDEILAKRRRVFERYDAAFAANGLPLQRQSEPSGSERGVWTYGVVVDDGGASGAEAVRQALATEGIETRPFFHPVCDLPMYQGSRRDDCLVSRRLADRGILLPVHTRMSDADVDRIVRTLAGALTVVEPVA